MEFEQESTPADDISVTSRQVGEDSDAHSIEQDHYGDEERVCLHFHCTEDPEAHTGPQIPEIYAEQEAGLPNGDTWSDVEYATENFQRRCILARPLEAGGFGISGDESEYDRILPAP
ncbi:hypothetical protein FOMG_19432 [Fusarium oxysporum f. sp. melonis 26406]|uniref:Uncharacterized protein n=1 Tax=Fusarium oxysporum f. sp. melonis 26406 TaxID=1089452 RepID=W9YXA8_FUSOX|nr:hypothetical protein FOMG_19432 [Fusarium oxysporum f. sp. melonis 26406]